MQYIIHVKLHFDQKLGKYTLTAFHNVTSHELLIALKLQFVAYGINRLIASTKLLLIIIIIIIIVLTSFFHASTGQTVFPPMRPFHLVLSCAHDAFRPWERRSHLTHSPHVFLPLPFFFCPATSKSLQADTQSRLSFRSR